MNRGMGFKIAGKNSLTLGVLINTPKRGQWGFITVLRGNGVPVISGGLFKIGARLRTDKWGRVVEAKKRGDIVCAIALTDSNNVGSIGHAMLMDSIFQ